MVSKEFQKNKRTFQVTEKALHFIRKLYYLSQTHFPRVQLAGMTRWDSLYIEICVKSAYQCTGETSSEVYLKTEAVLFSVKLCGINCLRAKIPE